MGIQWNNAPLAQENISASWIYPLQDFPGIPGIPYDWAATKAVAEAYADGRPVSMAIYSSDIGRDTSKYLYSSEVDDWIVEGRPKLTVVWGDPMAEIHKTVIPQRATYNDPVTYALDWLGIGQSLIMTDTLPVGLSDPGSLIASNGSVSYDAGTRQITWSGIPDKGQVVTLIYTVTVQTEGPLLLSNTATLFSADVESTTSATICIDCNNTYLPVIKK